MEEKRLATLSIRVQGMRLASAANAREHWRVKHSREKAQVREIDLLHGASIRKCTVPCVVTLTRHGIKYLDDDNLSAAFKRIRDYIATQLLESTQANQHGRRGDDSDCRIAWEYEQETGPYAVRITIQ